VSTLTPIMVRTFGRTGSTLLMQILGTSKQIIFEREYPFEHRYLTYVFNMARMTKESPKANDDWNNDVLFQCRSSSIGSMPYGKTGIVDKDSLFKYSFVSLWEQYSRSMREVASAEYGREYFYAEKVPAEVADAANVLLRAKNIFLLRDPRDEMVSIMSFNKKRGFHSFGWTEDDTDVSYAIKMCNNRRFFMQHMLKAPNSERRINIKYEDLIANGHEEVERLSEWAGVPMCLDTAMDNAEIQKRHMTSRDSASSVERWRGELSDEVQGIFSKELGQELSNLGYAV